MILLLPIDKEEMRGLRKLLHSIFKKEPYGGNDEYGADKKHPSKIQANNDVVLGKGTVPEPDIDRKAAEFINNEHHLWTDRQLKYADKKAAEFINKEHHLWTDRQLKPAL